MCASIRLVPFFCFFLLTAYPVTSQTEVYELKVYELEFFRDADLLHTYFEKALIPALNRQGANHIGVFEEVGESLPKKFYLLIPHRDSATFQNSEKELFDDEAYFKAANSYLTADKSTIPFTRGSSGPTTTNSIFFSKTSLRIFSKSL